MEFLHHATHGPAGFAAGKCSTIGGIECNVADAAALKRSLAGEIPAVDPVCSAATP